MVISRHRYSPEVLAAMKLVKAESGGWCERCHEPHNPLQGYTLTVHHLEPVPGNIERWNLAALCQRCHLGLQHHNPFSTWLLDYPEYYLSHCEFWFRSHLQLYFLSRKTSPSQTLPLREEKRRRSRSRSRSRELTTNVTE